MVLASPGRTARAGTSEGDSTMLAVEKILEQVGEKSTFTISRTSFVIISLHQTPKCPKWFQGWLYLDKTVSYPACLRPIHVVSDSFEGQNFDLTVGECQGVQSKMFRLLPKEGLPVDLLRGPKQNQSSTCLRDRDAWSLHSTESDMFAGRVLQIRQYGHTEPALACAGRKMI